MIYRKLYARTWDCWPPIPAALSIRSAIVKAGTRRDAVIAELKKSPA